ncbi:MAG: DUF1311 domain-containing protein [Proteobacteria bacterium]|nr:DUF1311 domain-containing protein [Pseudomonadota bacterium]
MINKLIFLVLFVFTTSVSLTAQAEAAEVKYSKEFDECIDNSKARFFLMQRCTVEELQKWEYKVDFNYKKILNSETLEDNELEAIAKIQSLWKQYRDAMCNFECLDYSYCGTANRYNQQACLLKMTAERNEDLEHLIDLKSINDN